MLSQYENGPALAKKKLLGSGIYFIIERHLAKTFLDGAAIRHPNGSPIIALTVRYDLLDNFWFVLFHELAHIYLHFGTNEDTDFFDDVNVDSNDIESEADEFALKTYFLRTLGKIACLGIAWMLIPLEKKLNNSMYTQPLFGPHTI